MGKIFKQFIEELEKQNIYLYKHCAWWDNYMLSSFDIDELKIKINNDKRNIYLCFIDKNKIWKWLKTWWYGGYRFLDYRETHWVKQNEDIVEDNWKVYIKAKSVSELEQIVIQFYPNTF